MVTQINDKPPVTDEDKILDKKVDDIEQKTMKTINDDVVFEVKNSISKTTSLFSWAQLRHMFNAKIEKSIREDFPNAVTVSDMKLTIKPVKEAKK